VKAIVALLVLLSFPALVIGGQVYQWVDEDGVVHFTDTPEVVPEDYRVEAETWDMPEGQPGRSLDEIADEEDEGSLEEEEGILIEDDLKEKDEAWWRSRAEKWRERLQAGYDDYERLRLRYNDMATEFNKSKDPDKREKMKAELDQMQMEMEKSKADIDKARKMTEEGLPSQAQKAGKPLEWVR